jgi:hypothetical protein
MVDIQDERVLPHFPGNRASSAAPPEPMQKATIAVITQ